VVLNDGTHVSVTLMSGFWRESWDPGNYDQLNSRSYLIWRDGVSGGRCLCQLLVRRLDSCNHAYLALFEGWLVDNFSPGK